METLSLETLGPVVFNMGMVLAFALVFIIMANIVSRAKRKIG